jgi:exodeoxyribonuclease VII small subunit
MSTKKEKSFEEALAALEKIVEAMESGDLTLEIALKKFETGVKLSETCAQKLNDAEEKINLLIKNKNGDDVLRPFSETDEENNTA